MAKGKFEDPNKSVYEGQKPEHGRTLAQDVFAGHDAEKKAYKDQHKDGKQEKAKLEENSEAAVTKHEMAKLNEKFKPYLPEGSQIVGHGHGKSGEYIFVKPSKDSKDVYAVNPDTGKPESHYRVVDHKWAQVKPEANGGETLKFPDKSAVTTDKEHHVTNVVDAHGKQTFHREGQNCTYTDKEGHAWASKDGGKTYTGPKGEKGQVAISEDGTVTAKDLKNNTTTIDRRDGSEVTYKPGPKGEHLVTHIMDAKGSETSIDYDDKGNPKSYKVGKLEIVSTDGGKSWTSTTDKTNHWPGQISANEQGDFAIKRDDKGETWTYKADGSFKTDKKDGGMIEQDSQGRVTHVKDAKGHTTDIHYDAKGNPDRYKDVNGDLWTSKDGHNWKSQVGKPWSGKVDAQSDGTVTTTGDDKIIHNYKPDGTDTWGPDRPASAPGEQPLENGAKAKYVDGKLTEVDTTNGGKHTYEYGDATTGDPKANGLKSIKVGENDTFTYNAEKKVWTHHTKAGDEDLRSSPYTDEKTGDFTYGSKTGWTTTLRGDGGYTDRDEHFRVQHVVDAKGHKTAFDYSKNAEHPSVTLPDGASWDWDSTFGDYRSGTPGAFQKHPNLFTSITTDNHGNVICQVKGGGSATFKANGETEGM